MAINGVNNGNNTTQLPQQVQGGESGAKVLEQSAAQLEQAAKELTPLLSSMPSLQVSASKRVEDTKKARDLTEIPEIDEAEPGSLEAIMNDLEALIALLQADQDEKTIEATKKRIESLKGQLEANHKNTMAKINESIDKMKEQEKSSLANKILGWIGVGIALLTAAVLCATGAGAPAAFAVVGAAIGLVTQIMNETGAMEKLTKALSEHLQKTYGMSKLDADAWAQGIIAGVQIVISLALLALSFGTNTGSSATALIKLSEEAAKALKVGTTVANGALTVASLASSAASTAINYQASMKQAAVTEMQAFLKELQTLLEEENDDMKQLLEKLQNSFAAVLELLDSKQATLNLISDNIGA